MKALTVIASFIFLASWATAKEIPWTHSREVGEDATSTHYYFYLSNGASIERVRWVTNGGAQNAPTVTEYLLGSGKITIREMQGKRDDINALVAGKEAALTLISEYSIGVKDSSRMLVPPAPDKSLTDRQRVDLANLINLLSAERKPIVREKATEKPSE